MRAIHEIALAMAEAAAEKPATSAGAPSRRGRPPKPGSFADVWQRAGRPVYPPEAVAINDDVRHWPYVEELIKHEQADRLNQQRPARARKLSETHRASQMARDQRIETVTRELESIPITRSAQDAARVLRARGVLPEIKPRTLRQYVTEARKLAGSRVK